MTILTDLLTARDTAGTRYAAAVAELRDSFVDLAAIDVALRNKGVGLPAAQNPPATFSGIPQVLPVEFLHPVYLPHRNLYAGANLFQRIEAATASKLAGV
jgi:hypothetical protein